MYDGPPDQLDAEVLTRIYGEEDWSATIRAVDDDGEPAAPSHDHLGPAEVLDRERLAGLS